MVLKKICKWEKNIGKQPQKHYTTKNIYLIFRFNEFTIFIDRCDSDKFAMNVDI